MERAVVINIANDATQTIRLGQVLECAIHIDEEGRGDCLFQDENGNNVDVRGLKLVWEHHEPNS